MIKINLLAEARPSKKKKGVSALGSAGQLNTILLAGAVVLGLIVIFVQYWLLNSTIKDYNDKIRVAQQEVARLEAILKEVKDFEDKKAKLQKKVDLINQLKVNQTGPVRLMDEVSRALPDLLWLERMSYSGSSIGLDGKAIGPNAVANFLENLKRVPYFQEPKLTDITACNAGNVSLYCYRMSFTFSNLNKTQVPDPAAAAAPGAPATGPGSATSTSQPPAPAAAGN